MSMIKAVKGTRDFYPQEMALRNYLYTTIRRVAESFGYQEYETPLLEPIELYAAKSGEELVKEQSFVFPDRGGDLITLRPELTPSLARMVAQRQKQLVFPLRWWSWGPFWRYERPQKGRTREFFQWNIDLIGVHTPEADAELVAVGASFLKAVGLSPSQIAILVNSRKLINQELDALDVALENRQEVFRLIDRRDKLSPVEWHSNARQIGLTQSQADGLDAVITNQNLWRKSGEIEDLLTMVHSLGLGEYVRFAPNIVRGLAYYTGIVFEAWDKDGEFRAVLGGGRYDNLVSDVGGEPLPATGFAMGDVVIGLVLKKFGCLPPELGASPAQVLVTVFDESLMEASFKLAASLRKAGLNIACYPEAAKLGKQFKYGDRMGLRLAIVLGPDELSNGQVAIKDLRSGEQHSVSQDILAGEIKRLLSSG